MVFSSLPAYLDPANWQQQPQQINPQTGPLNMMMMMTTSTTSGGSGSLHQQHLLPSAVAAAVGAPPPPPPPPPPPLPAASGSSSGGGGPGSIRPGSMADRARMANMAMPEMALKCPRCESTNTKFCYFNNYSLSQPRHFCKTCRRYWTRGGALRNVPVGGGCRRNKRSSSSGSKSGGGGGGGGSSSKSDGGGGDNNNRPTASGNSSSSCGGGGGGSGGDIFGSGFMGVGGSGPPLRFMAPLHHHNHHGHGLSSEFGGEHHHLGLSYGGGGGMNNIGDLNFQMGGGGAGSLLSGMETWRLQQQMQMQLPFFGGGMMDSSASSSASSGALMYPFESGEAAAGWTAAAGKSSAMGLMGNHSMITTQLAAVKMEESLQSQERNLARQQLQQGYIGHNNGWGTGSATNSNTAAGGWSTSADLSSFTSSSTSNNQL